MKHSMVKIYGITGLLALSTTLRLWPLALFLALYLMRQIWADTPSHSTTT